MWKQILREWALMHRWALAAVFVALAVSAFESSCSCQGHVTVDSRPAETAR